MPKDVLPELTTEFSDALNDAHASWKSYYNAKLKAKEGTFYRKGKPLDRDQFMSDIGEGWIVPEGRDRAAAIQEWRDNSASQEASPREGRAMAHAFSSDSEVPWRGGSAQTKAGGYMGKGGLGTPVYIGPGTYGAAFTRLLGDKYEGRMGAFAPGGASLRSDANTGTLGHELGHAKQSAMDEGYRGKFYEKSLIGGYEATRAATEAVGSYLGRRIIRAQKGWGGAADDKSWNAYEGLPSYLVDMEDMEVRRFLLLLKSYEDQYPGLLDETKRAITEYDTLVAPKGINDTSKGDWSEEGLKFMKEWRKKKGLKEVPTGDLNNRARQMGPYSRALKSSGPNRLS
tara:strand:+ start:2071 stop:3096 length:1026 start_codon:yes stop_codon:yes gene_type:complete